MGSYKSDLSQDYLRALSIFKRKLQLLGFYPLVSNDDGLAYAPLSVDPYQVNDEYDDRMYELLKKRKKERKARKKQQKKKSKTSKKATQQTIPTTTVQPVQNIVYYWPFNYQQSFDTRIQINENGQKKPYDDESSEEEDSSEAYASSDDERKIVEKQTPAKIDYETRFGSERKLDDDDKQARAVENQTSIDSTSSTSTTTPYPLLTVVPDPEEVAIQEFIYQQEIVNKISENDQGNKTKAVPEEDLVDLTTESSSVFDLHNSTEVDAVLDATVEESSGVDKESARDMQETKSEVNSLEESVPTESTTASTDIDVTEPSTYSTESAVTTPTVVLQFFRETLPELDELPLPIGTPSPTEIVDNFSVPRFPDVTHTSVELPETTENNENTDGHRETGTEPDDSAAQISEETTTSGAITQPMDKQSTPTNSSDDQIVTDFEVPIPNSHIGDESEGYEYSIDPKISLPMVIDDDSESRSLTDKPGVVAIVNDKSGRRSDVPIEADDINDEDATDNLPYNLTGENLLEQSNVIESRWIFSSSLIQQNF